MKQCGEQIGLCAFDKEKLLTTASVAHMPGGMTGIMNKLKHLLVAKTYNKPLC